MILTIAQTVLKLDKKGFTRKEAVWADVAWILCFTAIGAFFWVQ
jgi:uncharacterized membrane protein